MWALGKQKSIQSQTNTEPAAAIDEQPKARPSQWQYKLISLAGVGQTNLGKLTLGGLSDKLFTSGIRATQLLNDCCGGAVVVSNVFGLMIGWCHKLDYWWKGVELWVVLAETE